MSVTFEWGINLWDPNMASWKVVSRVDERAARLGIKSYAASGWRGKLVRRKVTVTRSIWEELPSLEDETLAVLREAAEIACYNEPGPDCAPGDSLCLGCHAKALVKRHES